MLEDLTFLLFQHLAIAPQSSCLPPSVGNVYDVDLVIVMAYMA